MVSIEEILITIMGKDEVTPVVNNMQGNVESSLSNMSQSANAGATSIGNAYQSTFDQIGQGLRSLNTGMMGISSVSRMMMSELGSTKSAMDWVYGTTSKEDTNKVLVKKMVQGAEDIDEAWDSLYGKIDKTTDASLTSMQDLIPAMNAFQSATQATNVQLEDFVAEDMAEFGAFVLAQTGSTQLSLTAMMDLSKGIKNQFASLDQYGISSEALKNTGMWKTDPDYTGKGWRGDPKDIEGYMKGVRYLIGDTSALMDTNEGLNAQMGKMWSRAGKRIGHEMMPGLKSLKQMFIDLDNEMSGNLSTSVLRVALAIEEAQQKMYQFNTLYDGTRNLINAFRTIGTMLGIIKPVQDANNLSIQDNTNKILANNEALMTNNDLRLANAEASGVMNLAMDGQNMNVPTDAVGDVATQSATDVLGEQVIDNSLYFGQSTAHDKLMEKLGNRKKVKEKYKDQPQRSSKTATDHIIKDAQNISRSNRIAEDLIRKEAERPALTHSLEMLEKNKGAFSKFNLTGVNLDELIANGKQQVHSNRSSSMKDILGLHELEDTIKKVGGGNVRPDLINKAIKGQEDKIVGNIDPPKLTELISNKFNSFKSALNTPKEGGYGKEVDALGDRIASPFRRASGTFTTKVTSAFGSFTTAINKLKPSNIRNALGRLNTGLGEAFSGGFKNGVSYVANGVRNLPILNRLIGTSATELVETGTEMAVMETASGVVATESVATGGEMAVAEGGITFMGLAEMGLAGAFTTLLIPTLAIALVIAILIPIVAGLVAEALFFVSLIGQLISQLDFGDGRKINQAVKSLQRLAIAFAWLGVTMASMTFAGILSSIGLLTASLMSLVGGFPTIVNLLTTVAEELAPLGSVSINPSIPVNLQNLANTLNAVSMAMLSLVGTQITSLIGGLVTGFGYLGTLKDTIGRAKSDLQYTIDAINSMNFSGIDENKITQIKSVLEAIGAFADAFSGLQDIRTSSNIGDALNWLTSGGIFGDGGQTIQEAFMSAHDDLVKASQSLQSFGDVAKVDPSIVENLQTVSQSITSVADSITSLRKLRDDYNWDDFVGGIFDGNNILQVFQNVKQDIIDVSNELKSMGGKGGLAKIPEGLPEKLQSVTDTLTQITGAIDGLKSISESSGDEGIDLEGYVATLKKARVSIKKVSDELNTLGGGGKGGKGGMKDISGLGLEAKLTALINSLTGVIDTINKLQELNNAGGGSGNFENLQKMIGDARLTIQETAKQLNKLAKNEDLANVTDSSDKLTTLNTGIKSVTKAVTNAKQVPETSQAEIGNRMRQAVGSLILSRNALSRFEGVEITDNSEKINTIKNGIKKVASATTNMLQIPVVSQAEMGNRMRQAVGSVILARNALSRLQGKEQVDVGGILTNIKNGVVKLKNTINNMNFNASGKNVGSSLRKGMKSGIGNLGSVFKSKIQAGVGGSRAYAFGKRMGQYLTNGFRAGLNLLQVIQEKMAELPSPDELVSDFTSGTGGEDSGTGTDGNYGSLNMGVDAIKSYAMLHANRNAINSRIDSLSSMSQSSTLGNTRTPVNINIGEGAVQLDARNMTAKESRQVMITALESLSMIENIDVNGA